MFWDKEEHKISMCKEVFMFRKVFVPIFFASLWIVVSEFVRNEFLLKSIWIKHYENLGLEFVTTPINGIIWFVWAFAVAKLIFVFRSKFEFWESVVHTYSAGFVLMWLVTSNLGVLPVTILIYAVPLGLVEVIVATVIIDKLKV